MTQSQMTENEVNYILDILKKVQPELPQDDYWYGSFYLQTIGGETFIVSPIESYDKSGNIRHVEDFEFNLTEYEFNHQPPTRPFGGTNTTT